MPGDVVSSFCNYYLLAFLDIYLFIISEWALLSENLVMNRECDIAFVGPEIGYVSMSIWN